MVKNMRCEYEFIHVIQVLTKFGQLYQIWQCLTFGDKYSQLLFKMACNSPIYSVMFICYQLCPNLPFYYYTPYYFILVLSNLVNSIRFAQIGMKMPSMEESQPLKKPLMVFNAPICPVVARCDQLWRCLLCITNYEQLWHILSSSVIQI